MNNTMRALSGIVAVLLGSGCGASCASLEVPFGSADSLAISRATLLADDVVPKLITKLDGSAYRYFRMLAPAMAQRTCFAFRDLRWHLPVTAVHGDAHLTQFVVTGSSAGLEDFDRAGYGPAVVDLVRYAASLHLACREVSFACDPDALVDVYFKAYRAALDRPPPPPASLAVAKRLRRLTPATRLAWLTETDTFVEPGVGTPAFTAGWSAFVLQQEEVAPERPARYFDIARLGKLETGVGS